ncbi:2-succinyl-6-hydroxy-2,4-cyclohexadiene-1-carboxylate synthase [Scandinavium manionii]|uniref:2-succinyl-6-hydroxy-2, 4-cyclohexadiene-1-carboxylate synthase n=1 Tax=Scandinavium manionii TaxID=2926520 RepID=UPI002166380C|nr:2-succinyl-6-hydroxy-2,4-cyclohexadiene-1-carboxylate synthase [Scandinavium manionii]MCS2168471.1 2-succinyl-6-hydroxy-2,4-cyclohexadiene-1-carboxylate synthase [Scandinavium manionii]
MTLHAVAREGAPNQPWLVFLHGFSGDRREWQAVGEKLTGFSRLYVDLPGHGGSAAISVTCFDDVCRELQETLISYNILSCWLIGYSLGGRVAMVAANQAKLPGLKGLIVEGAHPGLQDDTAREARLQSDTQWAQRFRHEPLADVFEAWYRQPVFASLTDAQRQTLVALRADNNGPRLADMLLATSLAVQPDLRAALATRGYASGDYAFLYLCGEHDAKFRALAEERAAPCHLIPHAGHNAHRENPAAVANCLAQILNN